MSDNFQRLRLVPYKWLEKYNKITENDNPESEAKKKVCKYSVMIKFQILNN